MRQSASCSTCHWFCPATAHDQNFLAVQPRGVICVGQCLLCCSVLLLLHLAHACPATQPKCPATATIRNPTDQLTSNDNQRTCSDQCLLCCCVLLHDGNLHGCDLHSLRKGDGFVDIIALWEIRQQAGNFLPGQHSTRGQHSTQDRCRMVEILFMPAACCVLRSLFWSCISCGELPTGAQPPLSTSQHSAVQQDKANCKNLETRHVQGTVSASVPLEAGMHGVLPEHQFSMCCWVAAAEFLVLCWQYLLNMGPQLLLVGLAVIPAVGCASCMLSC